MHVSQVHRTYDTVDNRERQRVYTSVVDNQGHTSIKYEEYYYQIYTNRAELVQDQPKGQQFDKLV